MISKDLESLIILLKKAGVGEFEWEKNKEKIRIKMKGADPQPAVSYAAAPAPYPMPMKSASKKSREKPAAKAAAAPVPDNAKTVISPFVGTYYEAPSPGAPKYCSVGQQVSKGDALCIIEAMKIMNEIESEYAGKVVEILVKNGDPVEFGQPLFRIE